MKICYFQKSIRFRRSLIDLERVLTRKVIEEYMIQPRVLLMVSVQPAPTMRAEIAAGQQPRRDYDALQEVLGADAIYPYNALMTGFGQLLKKIFGARIALVWAGFRLRSAYDI